MMQHIDVSSVLRQAVACDLYSNLVTRPTGAAVRAQIQALLGAVPRRALAVIDFTHVQMIDYSCADEVVAKLLLPYADGVAVDDSYFIFRGVSDDHWDAIEAVLERHGIAMLVEEADAGSVEPKGVLPADQRLVWDTVRDFGAATAEDVAGRLGKDHAAVEATLASLHQQRLLMRSDGRYRVVAAPRG